ncbi:outer membrane beta-barrel protein [Fusobacterium sp.]|uniref:outer membrane beta-barrel protein n=1 Tax=Fusobacterium sp. TaxID=68766 RepID=UPI0026131125|nr:outer membrane beta-barrel protein [Fusobacterium sp.]
MKKILLGMTLLSTVAMGAEGTNLYLRAGADINGKFDVIVDNGQVANKKKADKMGHEIAVEVTKEVLPNFELGLGVAYQNHGKAEKNIENLIYEGRKRTIYYEMPEMKSIPLYVTTKYNLPVNTMIKPYLKADLGYSFNKINGKLGWNLIENNHKFDYPSYETEVKNGAYFGIGGGFEYNDFTMDLMYKINKAELEYGEKDSKKREKKDLDYSRITLSVGYKFNF